MHIILDMIIAKTTDSLSLHPEWIKIILSLSCWPSYVEVIRSSHTPERSWWNKKIGVVKYVSLCLSLWWHLLKFLKKYRWICKWAAPKYHNKNSFFVNDGRIGVHLHSVSFIRPLVCSFICSFIHSFSVDFCYNGDQTPNRFYFTLIIFQ